ncbi:M48 family metalloprotease [Maricurvus nonylphenolicus]|uniref:M48 family metalloprotease n=1 Tax=Maricurvus nonylphenolicus TaxID=1008307 RepID=UPI0036F2532B
MLINRELSKRSHKLIVAACSAALLTFSSGCAINPATGTPDLVLMSEDSEIKKGKELHEKLMEGMAIYQDEKLQTYIEEIGQTLVKNSDRPDIAYTFTIIDSPDINAFALPGGYIYINRGLIGFLKNEAQLAAVLAHEIGHVTARHAVRQDAAKTGAKVGSTAASIISVLTTGNTALGDVTGLWSSAAVMGYGREMELEADSFGAQYLYNSGYEPQAMADVIGVLKDHERFSRRRARDSGKKQQSYHGVFSTHPRNDTRLQEVIAKAGTLPENQEAITNEDIFRKKTEGMIYGINYQPKKGTESEHNDYTHKRLGFTLRYPDEWKVENTRSSIVAAPEDKHAHIDLRVSRLKEKIAPEQYLRKQFNVTLLKQSEAFKQHGLYGHTGIIPASADNPNPRRVAVLYQGSRVYSLECEAEKPVADVDYDEMFLNTIHSFRPVRPARRTPKSKTLHYVKANDSTTFSRLAQHVRLGKYSEEQLRLLNGYYPRGEPQTGEWIKIVQ